MDSCSEEGCERFRWAKGMCRLHYLRWDRKEHPEKWKAYDRKYKDQNRERIREQAKARYAADPEHHIQIARRSIVKRKYGITLEEYEVIIARGCAICGGDGPRMALDHNHANGKIRDALCTSCNNGLGRFKDDPILLRSAADYLEQHR